MKQLALYITIFSTAFLLSACSFFGSGDKNKGGKNSGALSGNNINAARDARFGIGSIPTAEGEGMFRDVRFDYDSARINDLSRQDIEYNVELMRNNPNMKVVLEGHCDERGTAEYNLALGEERSNAVAKILESYGIPNTRVKTVSYGEELPLDPSHTEHAYAQNRRVHFSAFR